MAQSTIPILVHFVQSLLDLPVDPLITQLIDSPVTCSHSRITGRSRVRGSSSIVDDVYVGTSGMGFEALMAGKKVHCYGMPFYAGWGVTEDKIHLPRRDRLRSLEDLFHAAYIESSRYFHPEKNTVVEVKGIVDYIVTGRLKSNLFSN